LLDVSENGRFVKILDFGIAKILGASRSTTVGRVVGSVYYMAPEQWKSEPLDARTDVYALGCIFHKILTGRLPYEYETANELMFAHVMQEPRALGEWRPELRIPEELDRTVLWALKKDPAERPQTVKQFWAAISRFERWLNVGLKGSTKEEYIPPSGPQGYVPERSGISGIVPPISSTAGGRMRVEQGGIGLGGIAKPEQPIMPGSTARLPKHDLSASVERSQQADAVLQQGGQRKLWALWLVIGLLLLINAGVVGYFLSQDKQKEQVSVVRPVSEIPQQGKAEERKAPVRSGEAALPRLPDAPVTPEIRREPPTPVVKQPPPKPKVQPKPPPKPKPKPPPKPKAKPKPPPKNRESIQERQARARHVMVRIPGGTFLMGSPDGEGDSDERPQLRINLPTYYIDKYEVSVEQYRRCVEAGSCKRSRFSTLSAFSPSCNYGASGRERHPMNCVSWHGARAYCAWAGKRLCNEAEWEKAARGNDGRKYPWGNSSPNCSRARYFGCGIGTVPVDALSAGASPYGVFNMSGNVLEWVEDCYSEGYYKELVSKNNSRYVVNMGGPKCTHRVSRGSWIEDARFLRAADRDRDCPMYRGSSGGLRCCARTHTG
jgi:formylglycine-generating enzyme required for sulfatase activity